MEAALFKHANRAVADIRSLASAVRRLASFS
jgi:hypothetical protein